MLRVQLKPRFRLIIMGITILCILSFLFLSFSRPRISFVSALSESQQVGGDLVVTLDYATYQGFQDQNSGLNGWTGIRYAAPPTGDNRWRAPQAPASMGTQVVQANAQPPRCPQTPQSPGPSSYSYQGDEDCLFLEVFAPNNAINLPVLFYIHGGGYGAGAAGQDFTQMAQIMNYSFVGVSIQYRLEAFGFLASSAMENDGTANAGLLDQHFALQWVQKHISKFGGDPTRVTLVGQSAGAGSIEMQTLAYGGSEGTKCFTQAISASPYTPVMYKSSDAVPEMNYLKLAKQAGCYTGATDFGTRNADPSILSCLRSVSTDTLQRANFLVGSGTNYGSWAFVPVVDGTFVRQRPSQQLPAGKVNGLRILTSHNSNEGQQFVDPNIHTAEDFNSWLKSEYPLLTTDDITQINKIYPYKDSGSTPYATCGDCPGPNTINIGSYATSHRQRAISFYSEATFICPSYWLASAYQSSSYSTSSKSAYKYQFSLPPGSHGLDLIAESIFPYPNAFTPQIGRDFHLALTSAWGRFLQTGDPSLSEDVANGNATGQSGDEVCFSEGEYEPNPATRWPKFVTDGEGEGSWEMLSLNQTGGRVGGGDVKYCAGDDVRNAFRKVDGYTWEGGQGRRCEFLRTIGERIPI